MIVAIVSDFDTISKEVNTKVAKEIKDISFRLQEVHKNSRGKLEYLQVTELNSLLKVHSEALINAFTKHILAHIKGKIYNCSICDKCFSLKSDLVKYQRNVLPRRSYITSPKNMYWGEAVYMQPL